MAFFKLKNRAISTLASAVDISQLTWTVANGEGSLFPSTGTFHVTCEDEIFECTSRSGDILTGTRGAESTSPAPHDGGKTVQLRITAGIINQIETDFTAHTGASQNVHGVGSGQTVAKVADIATDGNLSSAAQAAITASHVRSHLITSTSDHSPTGLTASQLLQLNSGGTAVESSGKTAADIPATPIAANLGGTGVANNAASTLTVSGAYATTLTVSGTTGVTLPTSGTLVTLAGAETLTGKTLTSPKIGTAITDTSGNELIKVTATGSAVNEITLANAATGDKPTITASGDDANVYLNLVPKGSGTVQVSGVDITTNTTAQTITNKRIQPRTYEVTTTSVSPAVSSYDMYYRSQSGSTFTISNHTDSPTQGENLTIRLKNTHTSQATTIVWGNLYRGIVAALPTTLAGKNGGRTLYLGLKYNSTDGYWDLVAIATQPT